MYSRKEFSFQQIYTFTDLMVLANSVDSPQHIKLVFIIVTEVQLIQLLYVANSTHMITCHHFSGDVKVIILYSS